MLGLTLLSLIVLYEAYILAYMKEYCKMGELIQLAKGRKVGDEVFDQVQIDLKSNKQYVIFIFLSYFYLLSLITLLFTQYWLIALVLFVLAIVVYNIKNNDDSIYINYLDSFTVVIVIVLGLVML